MGKRQKNICPFSYWRAEREIQNAQVLSMSLKSGDKRTYVWAKAERICPFSYWSVVKVIKVQRQKDICMGEAKRTCVL